jgi:hypothetical protein
VSDSLNEIAVVRGFRNVKYLVLFTEPTSYHSGVVPAGETQWSYYVKMVRAIHARLVADNRRGLVKLVGPNNTRGGVHLKEAVAELNDAIDIYSGHDYNKPGYDGWFVLCRSMVEAVAPAGKPLWLDEHGKQDESYRQTEDYGNYVAQIIAAAINAGVQTTLQWLLFDQQYVAPIGRATSKDSFHGGVHRWGACKWPHDDIADPASCYPQWRAVSLMSKYLGGRAGTKAFATQGDANLRVAATGPGGTETSVLVVNTSDSAQAFSMEFTRPLKRGVYRHSGTTTQIHKKAGKRLRDTIPPRGVAIYSTISGR